MHKKKRRSVRTYRWCYSDHRLSPTPVNKHGQYSWTWKNKHKIAEKNSKKAFSVFSPLWKNDFNGFCLCLYPTLFHNRHVQLGLRHHLLGATHRTSLFTPSVQTDIRLMRICLEAWLKKFLTLPSPLSGNLTDNESSGRSKPWRTILLLSIICLSI